MILQNQPSNTNQSNDIDKINGNHNNNVEPKKLKSSLKQKPKPPSTLSLNVEHLNEIENNNYNHSITPTITIREETNEFNSPNGNTINDNTIDCNNDNEPPNGGYGWIIVFASFMCNLTVDGVCYTFGIFLPHFLKYFQSNEAITALSGSLLSGCYMTIGVFVSFLVNRFGCRPITIIGSIMASLAFVLSTRATNVYILLITYGIVAGCSFGFIYLPSIVSVGHYFTTKRAFATGIAVCGSGMGAFLFSPFCQYLLANYDWKQSLLILSVCIGLCSIYGLLMKPLPIEEQIKQEHKQQQKLNQQNFLKRNSTCKSTQSIASIGSHRYHYSHYNNNHLNNGHPNNNSNMMNNRNNRQFRSSLSIRMHKSTLSMNKSSMSVNSKYSNYSHRSFVQRPRTWTITSQLNDIDAIDNNFDLKDLKDILDFSVLKITPMWLLALSNIFGMIGYYIPYVYIVRFATDHYNIHGNKAAWLLSSIGISNVIGRLAFGLISDRFSGANLINLKNGINIKISALLINNVCLLIAGLSTIAIPFCSSFFLLILISILFGFTISSYMSLTSIILVDILSLELLTTTFGLISCVRGISAIIGPPLAGLLYDLTLSYTYVFLCAGLLLAMSSFVSFFVHRYEYFD